MKKFLSRFKNDESGATAIEYGLIAALISVALIGGATALGGSIDTTFNDISDTMDGAAGGTGTGTGG